jgi:hypothetical protein
MTAFLILEDAERSVEVYCKIQHLKSKDLVKKPALSCRAWLNAYDSEN